MVVLSLSMSRFSHDNNYDDMMITTTEMMQQDSKVENACFKCVSDPIESRKESNFLWRGICISLCVFISLCFSTHRDFEPVCGIVRPTVIFIAVSLTD